MPPRQSTGHINWSQFTSANRGATERTAKDLMAPVANDIYTGSTQHDIGEALLNREIEANTLQGIDRSQFRSAEEMERKGGTTYGGPNAATDEEQFAAGLGAAERAGNVSKRNADMYTRMGSLKDAYGMGNPGYSRGMQAFDSALLDTTSGADLRGQAKQAQGLLDKFSATRNRVGERVGAAKEQTANAAGEWQNAYDAWRNAPPPRPAASTEVPEYLRPPDKPKQKPSWFNKAGHTLFGGGGD